MNTRKSDSDVKQILNGSLGQGRTLREMAHHKIHHGRKRFINPWNPYFSPRILDIFKWKLLGPNEFRALYKNEQVTPVMIDWDPVKEHRGLSVTFVTHSTVMIKDIDTYILIDPVLFGLPWPIQNFTPLLSGISGMPKPDYVLITHGHYDHLDKHSISCFADAGRFVSPLGYRNVLHSAGARTLQELDWFDSLSDRPREVVLLPCNHWTMRSPFIGPNTALWGSYLIKTAAGPVIYISGDTAYFDRFSEIGREFAIDLAIFNLGAYEPRWFMKQSHMNPAEAARAFRELGAKKLMAVHWGTFRLGDDPVYFPPLQIRQELGRLGLSDRLEDIKHGQTLFFANKV